MRTKDELFRAAQREIAARRQHAVMPAAPPTPPIQRFLLPMMPRCGQGFR